MATDDTAQIAARITEVLKLSPATWAIEFQDSRITWGDLDAGIAELGRHFKAAGLGPDSVVGLLGRNWVELVTGFLGIIVSGHGTVLINPIRPPAMVASEVEQLQMPCVIAARSDCTPALKDAATRAGSMLLAVEMTGGSLTCEKLTPMAAGRTFRQRAKGTLIEIQTSGTTGAPKRIPIAEKTIFSSLRDGLRSAEGVKDSAELKVKASPTLMFGPLVHTSGTFNVLMSVFDARPIVLFDKFSVTEFAQKMAKHKAKFVALPPTALKMVLDSGLTRADLSSLIAVRCGTAPLPVEMQLQFEEKFGVPVLTNYGATEFLGTVAGWNFAEYKERGAAKRGSVGRANPGVELRVVDPATFAPVVAGETGVLEAKVKRIDGGRDWIRTSDLARIDADGFLFILGRTDDAIIRGGFKVMAGKVMDTLRQHPGVFDACVLGIPDERLGQVPVAAVERVQGAALTQDDLVQFCKERLVAYEIPARIVVVDKLPRTISDKASRPDVLALIRSNM